MKADKQSKEYLDNLRHSCAHLLAKTILTLWPGSHNAIGPSIENGFYQDFDMGNVKISDADFPKIEMKMREILSNWTHFDYKEVTLSEAKKLFKHNPYKVELATEFAGSGKKLTVNDPGDFLDLCKMVHIDNPSKEMQHFKLLSVAGAYWRGSEKNKMLTRIYGTAFPTQQELDNHLVMIEEAKKRDHRILGKSLDLFSTNPLTGPGLILWHPKLAMIRNIVEQFWKNEHYKAGYQLVFTPHIAGMDMFVKSRHYNKYINSMFPAMLHQYIEGESKPDYSTEEQLKPMNCPNHIQIFKDRPRSYRELPLRMGELGTVYRYERAGTLHGLTRVRGFTQDDSHIFCTPQQVIEEIRGVIRLTKKIYEIFGFKEYKVYVATRPKKYLGSLGMWDFAEKSLKDAAKAEGLDFQIDEGEGVFYGPKIDSKLNDSLGREWQLGTVQFDFNQPTKAESTKEDLEEFWAMKTFKDKFKTKEKLWGYLKKLGRGFDVTYIDNTGKEKQTVMIHRTILGSMERFFGVLIEHFGGAFPTWLSPIQVKILPIAERHMSYALSVKQKLESNDVRVELDESAETLGSKIRNTQMEKVPYMLIVGDKEEKDKKVAVRLRDGKDLGPIDLAVFIKRVEKIITDKSLNL